MRKQKHFSKKNKREEIDPLRRAQATMEVLIIIGVLVIGVIIFGTFYFGNIGERARGVAGNPGDYNQSDLESSYEKAFTYDGIEEITMSGGSSHTSDGIGTGTGGDGGSTDPCNYNGYCDSGETTENCPSDCSTIAYYFNSLELSFSPNSPFVAEEFKIKVSADTNYDSLKIYKVEVFSDNLPTKNCEYNKDYNSIFLNLGSLIKDAGNNATNDFYFSCNFPANYKFRFYARPPDVPEAEINNTTNDISVINQNLEFISVWENGITGSGLSEMNAIVLPIYPEGTYNFNVDWGDGSLENITSGEYVFKDGVYEGPAKHVYKDGLPIHTVIITGTIEGFSFYYDDIGYVYDAGKIREISQWGPLRLENKGRYFEDTMLFGINTSDLNITATDRLDLRGTTNLSNMFKGSYVSNIPSINEWDVSNVTDMSGMFKSVVFFNEEIGSWDVSNVTDMSEMFFNSRAFNQSLSSWDVSNVIDMSGMFKSAQSFNQVIGSWDVSSVTDMSEMFYEAEVFNRPLNNWNVSSVTDMSEMFYEAEVFNRPLNNWDVSNVTDMGHMFYFARNFNQPLSSWNVSNVTNMQAMFDYASNFDQNISYWNVSNVTDMGFMFKDALDFNQDISSWNVDNVTNWDNIFFNCPILPEYQPIFPK